MNEADLHEQVASIEERLEDLADSARTCRKMMAGSRIAAGISGVWLLAMLLGVVRSDPVWLTIAIAGLLGGFVFLGSNGSTLAQVEAGIAEAEAERAGLIDRASLRLVSDRGLEAIPGGNLGALEQPGQNGPEMPRPARENRPGTLRSH